jgi:hypothetical protein
MVEKTFKDISLDCLQPIWFDGANTWRVDNLLAYGYILP